jgi:hypothetical protein
MLFHYLTKWGRYNIFSSCEDSVNYFYERLPNDCLGNGSGNLHSSIKLRLNYLLIHNILLTFYQRQQSLLGYFSETPALYQNCLALLGIL